MSSAAVIWKRQHNFKHFFWPISYFACVQTTVQTVASQTRHYQSILAKHFTFQLLAATGQGNETIPPLVRSRMNLGWLLSSQYIQQTNRTYTTFSYTVFSQEDVSQIELYQHLLVLELNVNQTCPSGFDISQEKSSCVCDPVLQKYTNNCNVTNGLGQMTSESDVCKWQLRPLVWSLP